MSTTTNPATSPELLADALRELEKAELIILAMLNAMTNEQKAAVHEQLQAAFVVDDAMTRHHERRAVIEKAAAALRAGKGRSAGQE